MSKWSHIYKQEINSFNSIDDFVRYKLNYKKKLIRFIEKYTPKGGKILEAGCGSGITCCFLSKEGYQVTGIDTDKDMLKLAKSISYRLNVSPKFVKMDLTNLKSSQKYFDVTFSNGVLEHFSDLEIVQLINQQLRISKIVIISVPSNYFSEKDKIYGNERFLNYSHWISLIRSTQGIVIKSFGFGFKNKVDALFYYFLKNKPIQKAQFIGFVIKQK